LTVRYVSVIIPKMKFFLKFISIGADNIIRIKNMGISAYQINNEQIKKYEIES
jgi:hypothetical protein